MIYLYYKLTNSGALMNKILNNNTLLSQKEIDTLVQFLTRQNNNIQEVVLSQDSIDKLIALLRNTGELNPDVFELSHDMLESVSSLEGYLLYCNIDSNTKFITIYARNSTGTTVKITPAGLTAGENVNGGTEWGYCIEPAVFDKIATSFKLKYTSTEYENVCRNFSMHRYGNEFAIIPTLYLPTQQSLAANMIE